jgi:type II secretory pathway pseudopilin PulG
MCVHQGFEMNKSLVLSRYRALRRQLGVSLLEMLGAISIGAVVTTGIVQQTNAYIDNVRDAQTAEHMRLYAQAARAYIKEHKNDTGGSHQITGTPKRIPVGDLAAYLPSGFGASTANPYGQSPCLVVKKTPRTVGGVVIEEVEGFLAYTDGQEIEPGRRQFVASMAGVGGGYIDTNNKPKGPGWSFDNYGSEYGRFCPAARGRPIVSLNLLEPTDPQDCRYLAVDNKAPLGCGDKMKRDLDLGGKTIFNLSGLSSTTINKPITIIGGVSATQNVTVGGNVTANTVSPLLAKRPGDSCVEHELGTIARYLAGTVADRGELLTCQNQNGKKVWEESSVFGCDRANNFCQDSPTLGGRLGSKPELRQAVAEGRLTRTNCVGRNEALSDCSVWQLVIKNKTFCSLGMVSMGQGLDDKDMGKVTISNISSDLRVATSIYGSPDSGYSAYSTGSLNNITGDFDRGQKRNDATFCRVRPVDKNAQGVKDWVFRVGTAQKVAVGCHLVCLD